MSVIEVKNLGKLYRIGERQRYSTLRDTMSSFFHSPGKWLKGKFTPAATADKFWALEGVSFKVEPGETLGIIGRNGAGKSTLLKILSRITPPTVGEVRLRGRVGSLLEVGTGFHPELTGRENISLNGAILGMRRKEIERKFDEIVEFSGIGKFLDTPVKRYSSGMYVRLAFSVAAHLEPDILIIDEVLAVGDAEFQKKCLGKMEEVTKKEGRTVLFVSHNLGAVQNLCSKTMLLKDGKLVTMGNTEEVVGKYLQDVNNNSSATVSLENVKREGNGKVKITGIFMADKNGQECKFFAAGQDAQLCFKYEVFDKNVKNFSFSVGIDSWIFQNRITYLGSKVLKQKITVNSEKQFKIYIKKMPLMPGRYRLTLFTDSFGEIFDWIKDAYTFDVEAGNFYESGELPPEGQGEFLMDYTFTE